MSTWLCFFTLDQFGPFLAHLIQTSQHQTVPCVRPGALQITKRASTQTVNHAKYYRSRCVEPIQETMETKRDCMKVLSENPSLSIFCMEYLGDRDERKIRIRPSRLASTNITFRRTSSRFPNHVWHACSSASGGKTNKRRITVTFPQARSYPAILVQSLLPSIIAGRILNEVWDLLQRHLNLKE